MTMLKHTISVQIESENGYIDITAVNQDKVAGIAFRNQGNTDVEINGMLIRPGEVLDFLNAGQGVSVDITRYYAIFKKILPGIIIPDVELIQVQEFNRLEVIVKTLQ